MLGHAQGNPVASQKPHIVASGVLQALVGVGAQLPKPNLLVHSDCGKMYRTLLQDHKAPRS